VPIQSDETAYERIDASLLLHRREQNVALV